MGNVFAVADDVRPSATPTTTNEPLSRSSIPPKAAALRAEANQLRQAAKAASEQSQFQYRHGSRAQAKALSNEKTDLYRRMNEKNRQAAAQIFRHFNQRRANDVIDLHGLYVNEALTYLQEKLTQCRQEDLTRLTVITGMGNNSPNGIAKIKPQVEKFVRQNHLKVTCYDGHLLLDLTTSDTRPVTGHSNANECIIL